jgi:hypothetical protein
MPEIDLKEEVKKFLESSEAKELIKLINLLVEEERERKRLIFELILLNFLQKEKRKEWLRNGGWNKILDGFQKKKKRRRYKKMRPRYRCAECFALGLRWQFIRYEGVLLCEECFKKKFQGLPKLNI